MNGHTAHHAVEGLEPRRLLAASIVADLHEKTDSGLRSGGTAVGGLVYFWGSDGIHGIEVWRTDGTAAGTAMAKDVLPGTAGAGARGIYAAGALAYFTTDIGGLWRSDGTEPGTFAVISNGVPVRHVAAVGDMMFFTILTGTGHDLWKTDGTAAGTVAVATGLRSPDRFAGTDSLLLFSAYDDVAGQELWKSDGTPGGTARVTDIRPGTPGSFPRNMTSAGDRVYFIADGPVASGQLWVSDGSPAGTRPIFSAGVTHLIGVNGHAYFAHGLDVYRSDGTNGGAVPLTANIAGLNYIGGIAAADGRVFFTARNTSQHSLLYTSDGTVGGTALASTISTDPGIQAELLTAAGSRAFFYCAARMWASDGTPAGTFPVTPSDVSVPFHLADSMPAADLGGVAVFGASHPVKGWEPYRSDGASPDGATLIRDVSARTFSGDPSHVTRAGETVFFRSWGTADFNSNHRGLYATDATGAGTVRLTQFHRPSSGFWSDDIAALNGRAYFSGNDDGQGIEPWTSDGTVAGTRRLRDIAPGGASSTPSKFVSAGDGLLLFSAVTSAHGRELWRTDGTEAGTFLLKDVTPGSASTFFNDGPTDVVHFNGWTYFRINSRTWRTDGTPGGTEWFSDTLRPFAVVRDKLYFIGPGGTSGGGLWAGDGTLTGTAFLGGTLPGPTSGPPTELVESGQHVYYRAVDAVTGWELWRTDGTPSGTRVVRKTKPGTPPLSPSNLVDVDGVLMFSAEDSLHGRELWRSDGTDAGTYRLTDLNPGLEQGCHWIDSVGGRAIFMGHTPGAGWEPWVSDGTPHGTRQLADVAPGPASSLSDGTGPLRTRFRGTLVFSTNNTQHGNELWQTDGRPGGTLLVRDIYEGSGSANASGFTVTGTGEHLYFGATSLMEGRELWTMNDDRGPVIWATFDAERSPHQLRARFNEDVGATLEAADWHVANVTTGQSIPAAGIALDYDAASATATLTFPQYALGVLPDGRYRATLAAGSVADDLGNVLAETFALEFTFLRGDANGDGAVNLQDFNRLASSFGQSNRTFSQGDFNYDGVVNLQDFNILASRFGNMLAAASGAATSAFGQPRTGDADEDDAPNDVLAW